MLSSCFLETIDTFLSVAIKLLKSGIVVNFMNENQFRKCPTTHMRLNSFVVKEFDDSDTPRKIVERSSKRT
ncbi:CLUMA_CG016093, isoform A [Clunio marinus]|uniref:CLUMA_CG016093, isoform A n=1 Tax=Clunio marinus TaxID=568069 RepID=A0A1J1IWD5_9DIPT|nr:CLUMA_CG016093, isoform A [Clunio marinus]